MTLQVFDYLYLFECLDFFSYFTTGDSILSFGAPLGLTHTAYVGI